MLNSNSTSAVKETPIYTYCDPIGNRDPITKMLGDRFATVDSADSSTYRYIKEIVGNKEDQEEYGMWVLNFFKLSAVASNKYI